MYRTDGYEDKTKFGFYNMAALSMTKIINIDKKM